MSQTPKRQSDQSHCQLRRAEQSIVRDSGGTVAISRVMRCVAVRCPPLSCRVSLPSCALRDRDGPRCATAGHITPNDHEGCGGGRREARGFERTPDHKHACSPHRRLLSADDHDGFSLPSSVPLSLDSLRSAAHLRSDSLLIALSVYPRSDAVLCRRPQDLDSSQCHLQLRRALMHAPSLLSDASSRIQRRAARFAAAVSPMSIVRSPLARCSPLAMVTLCPLWCICAPLRRNPRTQANSLRRPLCSYTASYRCCGRHCSRGAR